MASGLKHAALLVHNQLSLVYSHYSTLRWLPWSSHAPRLYPGIFMSLHC